MSAIIPGNLIWIDALEDVSGGAFGLGEWDRTPTPFDEIQSFSGLTNPLYPTQETSVGGDIIVFPGTSNPGTSTTAVMRVSAADGSVSTFIAAADAWASFTRVLLRASVDASGRYVVVADDGANLYARRFNSDGTILDTITLESPYLYSHPIDPNPPAVAIAPNGQYVYAIIATSDDYAFGLSADTDVAVYRYDLDAAGARSTVKTYHLYEPGTQGDNIGVALGVHTDGTILVGYWTTSYAPFTRTNTFKIDRLAFDGTVQATINVGTTSLSGVASGDPVTALGAFNPAIATDTFGSGNTAWGFVNLHDNTHANTVVSLFKLDLDGETASLTEFYTPSNAISYPTGYYRQMWVYSGAASPAAFPGFSRTQKADAARHHYTRAS